MNPIERGLGDDRLTDGAMNKQRGQGKRRVKPVWNWGSSGNLVADLGHHLQIAAVEQDS